MKGTTSEMVGWKPGGEEGTIPSTEMGGNEAGDYPYTAVLPPCSMEGGR